MKKKRIQYYDSNGVGSGERHLTIILRYLMDVDKEQQRVKSDEWMLVPCTTNVPQQKNGFVCGVFICMFGYFILHDCSLLFNEADVTSFQNEWHLQS
jgi:Ulp1 family protease